MADIDIEVKGLIELQRKTEQMVADLHGVPILDAMRDSVLVIQRDAKINAPVNTGRLRASITPGISAMGDSIEGVVGTNVEYAPYVEFGTKPHFPPILAIAAWVHKKGFAGKFKGRSAAGEQSIAELYIAMQIALKIAARGTKAHQYLQPAFESNQTAIIARFDRALDMVVEK